MGSDDAFEMKRKPRYRCILQGFLTPISHRPDVMVAVILRLESRVELGSPVYYSFTKTSMVLKIDFTKKEIETCNSIYLYGEG